MNQRRIFTVLYLVPGSGAMLHWLMHHPAEGEAPAIAVVTFGGLALLILASIVVVPAVLRRQGAADRGEQLRRAAVAGVVMPLLLTFLWSFMFIPTTSIPAQVALGVAGCVCIGVAIWADRRLAR